MHIKIIAPPPTFPQKVGEALVGVEFSLGTPMDHDGSCNVMLVKLGFCREYEIYEMAMVVQALERKDPQIAKQLTETLSGVDLMCSCVFPEECCQLVQ